MGDNPFDNRYDGGETEYEQYLKTAELLGLQKPPERRTHPQELFFQIVHQVEELWMKLAIHELGNFVVNMKAANYGKAGNCANQAIKVLGLCENQLRLFSHMQPSSYLAIRAGLGQGSGMDSPGFKRINEIAAEIWSSFEEALSREDVELLTMYQNPELHPALMTAAESLVCFDSQMQRFKQEHLMVVKRITGMGTASLRGNPVEMLERGAKVTFFPMLWAVRDRLFLDFKAGSLKI